MTKIKFCGLTRHCDVEFVNQLLPDYVGFVFSPQSRRFVKIEAASEMRLLLDKNIKVVGVFVDEKIENVANLLKLRIIDFAQLHGNENEHYIKSLKEITQNPIIKALHISNKRDVVSANSCSADYILLDSENGGTGNVFDWSVLKEINRPYFLAGGLCAENVGDAVSILKPYAVDVSSGIEQDGVKSYSKMKAFIDAVRKEK